MNSMKSIKEKISNELKEEIMEKFSHEIDGLKVFRTLSIPKEEAMGDLATSVSFMLAKVAKDKPINIAEKLKDRLERLEFIEKVEIVNGYLNMYFDYSVVGIGIGEINEKYGFGNLGKGKKVLIEYSAPNSNKPLHLGHLRNNALGMSISKILENQNYEVVKVNMVNDRGAHICKSMWGYLKYGEGKTPETEKEKPDHFVVDYYIKGNDEEQKSESVKFEILDMLKKWEEEDKDTRDLWQKMNNWAIEGWNITYEKQGIEFDDWIFESKIYNKAEPIVEKGLEKGLFQKDETGAIFADLEEYNLGKKLIKRQDGTSIYVTNDLALGPYKFDNYGINYSLYIVGSEQKTYFEQLFKMFELLGYDWYDKCVHVAYGLFSLPSGKMSSRSGDAVWADDILDNVMAIEKENILQKYPSFSMTKINELAKIIGVGALNFFILKLDAMKSTVFDIDKALALEGDTGPYVQYSYVRCLRIMEKAGLENLDHTSFSAEMFREEPEKKLVKKLYMFPEVAEEAATHFEPNKIAMYLIDLAGCLNSFYNSCPVLVADSLDSMKARLALVNATKNVIKRGLELLNIQVPDMM